MVITIQALRSVSLVFSGFMIQIVRGERLTRQNISTVTFVPKHLYNGIRRPVNVPQIGLPAQFSERLRDLGSCLSVQIHVEDQLYRGGLLRINHEVSIRIVGIAQQLGRQRQSPIQPHPE